MDIKPISDFFSTTPLLAELCSQNGWPDPQSLKVEVMKQEQSGKLLCSVRFDEVVMEGAGCEAGHVPCWGRFWLSMEESKVVSATLEVGSKS